MRRRRWVIAGGYGFSMPVPFYSYEFGFLGNGTRAFSEDAACYGFYGRCERAWGGGRRGMGWGGDYSAMFSDGVEGTPGVSWAGYASDEGWRGSRSATGDFSLVARGIPRGLWGFGALLYGCG